MRFVEKFYLKNIKRLNFKKIRLLRTFAVMLWACMIDYRGFIAVSRQNLQPRALSFEVRSFYLLFPSTNSVRQTA